MAQRRMIHEKILGNADFGTLSPNAKTLFIFCIVLADDDGRLKANATVLRGRVFAFNPEITETDVRTYLNEIVKKRLVVWYKIENEYFIQHPNWNLYQKLRTDRKRESDIPPPDGNQRATKGRHGAAEVSKEVSKISKKDKEAARPKFTASIKYLKNIPEADMNELTESFKCEKSEIIAKANSLIDYCEAKGRIYKNYKAFLSNALRSDFGERPKKAKTPIYDTSSGTAKIIGYKEN